MTGLPASLLGLSLLFSFQGLTSPLPLGGARPVIDLSETHKDPLSEWVQGRLSAVSESYPGRTTSVVNSLPVINRVIISLRPKGSSFEPKFFAAVRLFLPVFCCSTALFTGFRPLSLGWGGPQILQNRVVL